MSNINDLLLKILHKLPAELSHNITIKFLKNGLIPKNNINSKNLNIKIGNISFNHPIGIAAGFDKNAETLKVIDKTGVSHIEIGTVTPRQQKGNFKPRIFRLIEDNAIINSLGFPSKGMKYVIERLENNKCNVPIGVNIGSNKNTKNHVEDYTLLTKNLGIFADWITVNISSPNTPGLRDLQTNENLSNILKKINIERKTIEDQRGKKLQIWLKISPDLNDKKLKKLIDNTIKHNIDALCISNTTTSRSNNLKSIKKTKPGGLSGKPLFNLSTKTLAKAYLHANNEIKFIGVGGIDSSQSAFTKILAGAHILQIYTGFTYNGPKLINNIINDLSSKMNNSKLEDYVGIKANEIAFGHYLND